MPRVSRYRRYKRRSRIATKRFVLSRTRGPEVKKTFSGFNIPATLASGPLGYDDGAGFSISMPAPTGVNGDNSFDCWTRHVASWCNPPQGLRATDRIGRTIKVIGCYVKIRFSLVPGNQTGQYTLNRPYAPFNGTSEAKHAMLRPLFRPNVIEQQLVNPPVSGALTITGLAAGSIEQTPAAPFGIPVLANSEHKIPYHARIMGFMVPLTWTEQDIANFKMYYVNKRYQTPTNSVGAPLATYWTSNLVWEQRDQPYLNTVPGWTNRTTTEFKNVKRVFSIKVPCRLSGYEYKKLLRLSDTIRWRYDDIASLTTDNVDMGHQLVILIGCDMPQPVCEGLGVYPSISYSLEWNFTDA